jgi:ABC-type transport system substrate-binding protein
MRKKKSGLLWLRAFIFCLIFSLLILLLWQNDQIERRMIDLSAQQQILSSAVTRLDLKLGELKAGTAQGVFGSRRFGNSGRSSILSDRTPAMPSADVPSQGDLHKVFSFAGTDPKGLNFILENGSDVSEDIRAYVTMTLAARLPETPNLWYGQLAERVELSDDFREYTIYLKRGIPWHIPVYDRSNPRYAWMGETRYVTASDVAYALKLILDPQVMASHLRSYYQDVEDIRILDDYSLVIRWKKKTYQSLSFTMGLFPMPQWLYGADEDGIPYPEEDAAKRFNEHWYNNRAIGCGPYCFVSWDKGMQIHLKRSDNFSGVQPPIRNIYYHLIRDKNQQLLNFQSGDLDLHELSVSQYREKILQGAPDSPYRNGSYQVNTISQMVYRYIGWNMEHYLFRDKRVRQAMAYAMDRQRMVDSILYGLGEVISGPFFPYSESYNHNLKPRAYTEEKAAELLAEAGWKDLDQDGILEKNIEGEKKKFEFPMLIYGYRPEVRSWATLFKEELFKLGIICHLQPVEWSVMQERMDNRDFVAYTGGWGLPWESDPYQVWHSSQADIPGGSNRVGFRNKEADKIIEELRSSFHSGRRKRLYHKLHEILYEEQPYLFLYMEKSVVVAQPWVKNIRFQPFRPHVYTVPWYVDR